MAVLFASFHLSLFSVNTNSLDKSRRLFSPNPNPNFNPHRLSFLSRNARPSPLSIPSAYNKDRENPPRSKKPKPIADEWGNKSDPEPELASEPTPPRTRTNGGKKSDPEAATEPDPPRGEDEWGEEAGSGYLQGNGSAAGEPDSDKLMDLKRCLVDTLYGTEYGLRASAEARAEILELVTQLEAENPRLAQNLAAEFLDGNWILLEGPA